MTSRNDWEAAAEAFIAAERERLGDLTPEDVEAYHRGELSDDEAARVRALLVYTADEPLDEAPLLTPAQLAHDREKLRARLAAANAPRVVSANAAPARRPRRWPQYLATAAALAFAALLVHSQLELRRVTRAAAEPRLLGHRYVLEPLAARRGPSSGDALALPADEESFVLAPDLALDARYRELRLDLVDVTATPPRVVWSARRPAPRDDEPLELAVSRRFLHPGTYRLDAYGLDAEGWQALGSYRVRL